jgi:hypothetical protein
MADKILNDENAREEPKTHHRKAVSLAHACRHLGIGMDTLTFIISRGDLDEQVERDEDGKVIGIHVA